MPRGAAQRGAAFRAGQLGATVALVLAGTVLHHWLATGLAAVTFIIFLKIIVAPHLPPGAQKLIVSA